MSQENVELVRSIYDDWLRGDFGGDNFDPDISMVESDVIPGATSAHGLDAVLRYMKSFSNYWAEFRLEPQEYIDAGDRVVVVARLSGRGKRSGIDVVREWAYVWTVRDARALRMEAYAHRDEALEAAGMTG